MFASSKEILLNYFHKVIVMTRLRHQTDDIEKYLES